METILNLNDDFFENIKKYVVYKITNKINDRFYYGSTTNLKSRINRHISDLNRNKHSNTFLESDWCKCGPENFFLQIIEEHDSIGRESLLQREQKYLDMFFDNQNLCYNINSQATHYDWTGKKHKEETKIKIGLIHKNKIVSKDTRDKQKKLREGTTLSEETKKKISAATTGSNNPNYGKTHSEETLKKISIALTGRTASTETKEKMKVAQSGRIHSEETKLKMSQSAKKASRIRHSKSPIPIIQYAKDGSFIKEYATSWEAADEHRLENYLIIHCCLGKIKTYNGFIWKYKE